MAVASSSGDFRDSGCSDDSLTLFSWGVTLMVALEVGTSLIGDVSSVTKTGLSVQKMIDVRLWASSGGTTSTLLMSYSLTKSLASWPTRGWTIQGNCSNLAVEWLRGTTWSSSTLLVKIGAGISSGYVVSISSILTAGSNRAWGGITNLPGWPSSWMGIKRSFGTCGAVVSSSGREMIGTASSLDVGDISPSYISLIRKLDSCLTNGWGISGICWSISLTTVTLSFTWLLRISKRIGCSIGVGVGKTTEISGTLSTGLTVWSLIGFKKTVNWPTKGTGICSGDSGLTSANSGFKVGRKVNCVDDRSSVISDGICCVALGCDGIMSSVVLCVSGSTTDSK